jgi:hypothetical protein
MKYLVSITIALLLICNNVLAQSNEISSKYDKIGKFVKGLAFVHQNGLVGVINESGKEIIKPAYDKISVFGNDNLAYTHKNGLVGLITSDGKVIIEPTYDYIGHFKGDNATVKKNGLVGVITRKGKIIVDIKYEKLVCENGGVVKAVNKDGSQVIIKTNK